MNCPTAAGNRPNAGCDGGRTELEPHAIGPHARLRRSEIIEHGRNEFRDGRMNVQRPLQDLVGGLGVRHVENAEARIEAGGNGEGCAVPVVHQSGAAAKGLKIVNHVYARRPGC
jgi:hypothetical protein